MDDILCKSWRPKYAPHILIGTNTSLLDKFDLKNSLIKTKMETMLKDSVKCSFSPLSNFKVGCVVRTSKDNYYIGANLELSLMYNLHAEQAAVHNAVSNNDKHITDICLNELPCGMCRQFLYEINPKMNVYVDNNKFVLEDLLPYPFSPASLGQDVLFKDYIDEYDNELKCSYSPYNSSECVVDLMMSDNTIIRGVYIENCAYNPSVLPMLGAISKALLHGYKPNDIYDYVISVSKSNILDHSKESDYIFNLFLES